MFLHDPFMLFQTKNFRSSTRSTVSQEHRRKKKQELEVWRSVPMKNWSEKKQVALIFIWFTYPLGSMYGKLFAYTFE